MKWQEMYEKISSSAELPDNFDYDLIGLGQVADDAINPNSSGAPIPLNELRADQEKEALVQALLVSANKVRQTGDVAAAPMANNPPFKRPY